MIVTEGRTRRVKVDGPHERVDFNVPISMALSLQPDADGRLSVSAALFALQHARYSKVVDGTAMTASGCRARIDPIVAPYGTNTN